MEIDRTDLSLPCADRHAELLPLALPPDAATAPQTLEFRSNNAMHQPLIRALALYGSTFRVCLRAYPVEEEIPWMGSSGTCGAMRSSKPIPKGGHG